jgi:hypothetical protein
LACRRDAARDARKIERKPRRKSESLRIRVHPSDVLNRAGSLNQACAYETSTT